MKPGSTAFSVRLDAPEPIHRQLVEQLRRKVASGVLTAGDELPSVRDLATALSVNPMTVSKAFSLMLVDGLIERRRGRPMVIARSHARPADMPKRLELLRRELSAATQAARELEVPAKAVVALVREMLGD